eukprot:1185512-Prorocentrum_minimum.AAC.4
MTKNITKGHEPSPELLRLITESLFATLTELVRIYAPPKDFSSLARLTALVDSLPSGGEHSSIYRQGSSIEELKSLAPIASAVVSLKLDQFTGSLKVTDVGLRLLAPMTNLRHLSLISCNSLTDKGFKRLAVLTSFVSLNLGGCEGVTNEGLNTDSTCTPRASLTRLNLRHCDNVTDSVVSLLSHTLPNLLSLNLTLCPHVRRSLSRVDMKRDHAGSSTWQDRLDPAKLALNLSNVDDSSDSDSDDFAYDDDELFLGDSNDDSLYDSLELSEGSYGEFSEDDSLDDSLDEL